MFDTNLKKSKKINKRAGPNKSVQGGSLVKIKSGLHARLFGSIEYACNERIFGGLHAAVHCRQNIFDQNNNNNNCSS